MDAAPESPYEACGHLLLHLHAAHADDADRLRVRIEPYYVLLTAEEREKVDRLAAFLETLER